jgi:hypothetical protein
MEPTSIGRIVHYTLTEDDAKAINKRRADFREFNDKIRSQRRGFPAPAGEPGATGHIGHIGNETREGEVCPAMIVRVFTSNTIYANIQVFLDGNDTYWVGSRTEGDGPGHWAFPVRT